MQLADNEIIAKSIVNILNKNNLFLLNYYKFLKNTLLI